MIRWLVYLFDIVVSVLLARMLSSSLQRRGGEPRPQGWNWRTRPGAPNEPSRGPKWEIHGEMVRHPVCGMLVSTELSQKLRQGERTLHFCSAECCNRYQSQQRRAG